MPVLVAIQGAEEKGLLLMPLKSTTVISYTNFKQGPQETSMDFMDCLQNAVEKQIEDAVLRESMLEELARVNANDACKCIINTLPFNPPPTLRQMIEACTCLTNTDSDNQRKKGRMPGMTMLGAAKNQETKNLPDWISSAIDAAKEDTWQSIVVRQHPSTIPQDLLPQAGSRRRPSSLQILCRETESAARDSSIVRRQKLQSCSKTEGTNIGIYKDGQSTG